MSENPPVVLTIAGFDPSSGAGVTADIKTIAAHSCYGVAAITALTVQSTLGVRRVEVMADLLKETLSELASDVQFAAVHIGMLGSAEAANVVADFLSHGGAPKVVLDPILRSTSGTVLLDDGGRSVLVKRLVPLSAVITPNLSEASVLTGLPVGNEEEMTRAAARLHEMGAQAVVITGGHLDQPADLLSLNRNSGLDQQFFRSERVRSNSTHGTGCAFSCSMACHLALGRNLPEAVALAKEFVTGAIGAAYPVGRGVGPINHFYLTEKNSGK
jgi:hydroxymethylpyrimidine/phosphomethylpyrimidine kinase